MLTCKSTREPPEVTIIRSNQRALGLQKKTAGAVPFLFKVKAHRGQPANEEANIQGDKAVSGKHIPTEWHYRTNQAIFTWLEPHSKRSTVSCEDQKSTRSSRILRRKEIRRGSTEEEVRKHPALMIDRVTGAWKQISKQRQ